MPNLSMLHKKEASVHLRNDSFFSILATDFGDLDSAAKIRVKDAYYGENYVKLRWSAFFILLFQIFFIVSDCLSGFYHANSLNYINLATAALMAAASLMFFLYTSGTRAKWSASRRQRFVYTAYMILIAITVSAYTFTDMYVRKAPYGICMCFLFVPIISPFYGLIAQALLFGGVAAFSIAVHSAAIGADFLGVVNVLFFQGLMFLTSCFFRSYFIRIMIYRERMQLMTNELIYRNKTDFLTDAAARACLYDDYVGAQKAGKPIGLAIYDIDDFKSYNDSFLHLTGDDCLKATCHAVKRLAAEHGGKVYRYGGDEFVVMFFGVPREAFHRLVPEINAAVGDLKLAHSDKALHPYVSVSVGATYVGDPDCPMEKALLVCDRALYEAKSNGKACAVIR